MKRGVSLPVRHPPFSPPANVSCSLEQLDSGGGVKTVVGTAVVATVVWEQWDTGAAVGRKQCGRWDSGGDSGDNGEIGATVGQWLGQWRQ
eukprot:3221932-Pyramimonas_sp.AAC.1